MKPSVSVFPFFFRRMFFPKNKSLPDKLHLRSWSNPVTNARSGVDSLNKHRTSTMKRMQQTMQFCNFIRQCTQCYSDHAHLLLSPAIMKIMIFPQIAIAIGVLTSNRGGRATNHFGGLDVAPACHCRVQWRWCHCWVSS